ncbi:MAG: histidine kinase [Herbinix sp.]|nr:histidine kinase [Herbinix sp.]
MRWKVFIRQFKIRKKIHLKLQTQLLIVFLFMSILPLLFASLFIYKNIVQVITERSENYFVQSVQKNSAIIDEELTYLEEFSKKLNIDTRLFEIFDNMDITNEVSLKIANKRITAILNGYKPWSSNIYSVHLVTPYYRFGEEDKNFYPIDTFYNSGVAKAALEAKGLLVWIPTYSYTNMYGINNLSDNQIEYGTLFSAVCEMNICDVSSGRVRRLKMNFENPILVINFREDYLLSLLKEYGKKDLINDVQYMVISKYGDVICSTNPQYGINHKYSAEWLDNLPKSEYGYSIENIDYKKSLITYSVSDVTDWIVVATVPVQSLVREISNNIRQYIIIIMIILFLLSIFFSYIISNIINNKVYHTLTVIKDIGGGNIGRVIQYDDKDEFAFFYAKLNEMSLNLKNLIYENYEVKIQQRDFEIIILNIQLNPHFLYNTLNIINWICLSGDTDKTSNMIVNLSRMLQYTSQNGNQLVPLGDDIDWLRRYVYIMQMRYENRFEIKINIPEELLKTKVPKLFLQPLVENTIVHGFKKLQRKGILEISAECTDKERIFTVEDNGCGMTQQRVNDILKFKGDSIGIANTDKRIKMIYGENYGINIHTQLEEGTLIIVKIPKYC